MLDWRQVNDCMTCVRKEDRPIFLVRSYEFDCSTSFVSFLRVCEKLYRNWFGHFVAGSWAQCIDPFVSSSYKFKDMDPNNRK